MIVSFDRLVGGKLLLFLGALGIGYVDVLSNVSGHSVLTPYSAGSLEGVTPSFAAWGTTFYLIGVALGVPIARILSGRFGEYRVLTFGYLSYAIDRQLETTASAMYLNLRRLQLYVTLKTYGLGFWEIFASTSPKLIVKAGNDKASGISLMLTNRFDPPELYIEEINSLQAGMGAQMVGAIIDALQYQPRAFQIRLNDRSPIVKDDVTWWQRIISAHPEFTWVRTQL